MRSAVHQNALSNVIRTLAAERSPACLVDTQGSFLFVNEAWDLRALAGGQDPSTLGAALIGTSWLDRIRGDEARQRHAELLLRALRSRGPRRAVVHVGEWNTPSTAALLSTRFEAVLVGGGEPIAVSVVHAIVRERPIAEVYEVVESPAERYRGDGGAVVQCSCCGRLQDPRDPERWDFVPSLLHASAPAAHAICQLCGELHYGPLDGT